MLYFQPNECLLYVVEIDEAGSASPDRIKYEFHCLLHKNWKSVVQDLYPAGSP